MFWLPQFSKVNTKGINATPSRHSLAKIRILGFKAWFLWGNGILIHPSFSGALWCRWVHWKVGMEDTWRRLQRRSWGVWPQKVRLSFTFSKCILLSCIMCKVSPGSCSFPVSLNFLNSARYLTYKSVLLLYNSWSIIFVYIGFTIKGLN